MLKKMSGNNIASIGGYLAGASAMQNSFNGMEYVRSVDGSVPISVRYRGDFIRYDGGGLKGIGGSADILISTELSTQAMVYRVPTGGKVAFSTSDGVGNSTVDAYYSMAVRSMARWCLDM